MTGHIDVRPDDLRDSASMISDARDELQGTTGFGGVGGSATYTGRGQHTANNLSTGFFEPGAAAQRILREAIRRFGEAAGNISENCTALSSALHIVADLYNSADHEEALKFAFLESEDEPAGLPYYIDPASSIRNPNIDDTGHEVDEEVQEGAVSEPETYTDRYPERGIAEHHRVVTESVDANGDPTVITNHQVEHTDGSFDYYTTTESPDGTVERSGEFSVDPQSEPRNVGDMLEEFNDRAIEDLPDYN